MCKEVGGDVGVGFVGFLAQRTLRVCDLVPEIVYQPNLSESVKLGPITTNRTC